MKYKPRFNDGSEF